jgi:hypothetical protein
MLLACVLECSSIGSIALLTVVVVLTRIGVNKEPARPIEPAPTPDPRET